jgi:2-dehydro-3-deoxyglucarate aldolase
MNTTNLKRKLQRREITLGSWLTLGNTAVAEIMAKAGFEWLVVDMEHSAITLDIAQQLIQVIEGCGVVPLVRVGENDATVIKRVMDAGAYGVIVPMINTKKQAEAAVNAVKYPPVGTRGVGLARAQGYGSNFEEYRDWVNKESIVIVQIEHVDAVNNLNEILKVKGVDGSIIGPYDLSASLGHPGEFNNAELKNALKRYLDICNSLKMPAGFHVVPAEAKLMNDKIKEGYRLLGFSLDTIFLSTGIKINLNGIIKQ